MSRKDFVMLANVMASTKPLQKGLMYDQWVTTVIELCRALSRTNGRFDKDRFYTACGYIE